MTNILLSGGMLLLTIKEDDGLGKDTRTRQAWAVTKGRLHMTFSPVSSSRKEDVHQFCFSLQSAAYITQKVQAAQ